MKILVTGGAGFIGSHIVDNLVSNGHDVVVIDDFSNGYIQNLNGEAVFYRDSIEDMQRLSEIFKKEKPEIVNHHAAQSSIPVSMKDPFFDATKNILGSLNLLECCREFNVKKLIYANTGGAIYGQVEEDRLPIVEEEKIQPISNYGVSKQAVENYLYLYKKNYELDYVSLRYGNVYGPRQNPYGKGESGVIPLIIRKVLNDESPILYNDGYQTRDFVYIKDVVSANYFAMFGKLSGNYNVGKGTETSIRKVLNAIMKKMGSKIAPIFEEKRETRPWEVRRFRLSTEKIYEDCGWIASYTIKKGINETVDWFLREYDNRNNRKASE